MSVVGVLTACLLGAESTPSEALLILSKGEHTLAIVDPTNWKVVAKLPVGEDPHEVIASGDGKFAYVSNYGGGAYNTLAVLDLVSQKALRSIDLGPLRGPHGLAAAGGKIWFTAEAAKAVGSYDPAQSKIDWIMGTGQNRTHMIFITEDLKRIYTTNITSATVTVMEKVTRERPSGPPPGSPGGPGAMGQGPRRPMGPPGGDWEETVISVGKGDEGFDVSPDGKELWTANAGDGTVSIIDLSAKKVVDTLQANVRSANRLKFTPDGKMVFISMLSGPKLAVIDAAGRHELKRVQVGRGAAGIQMQPDGRRVFAACTPDNYVAVIDPKTLQVVSHIDAGPQPDGMAWAIRR